MNHSTGNPTKAQQRRMDAIRAFGCIACHLDGTNDIPCVVHHMLSGNKRIGHDATIGLCPAHHKRSTCGLPLYEAQAIGPCWHEHRRAFRERYGCDDYLVALQDEMLGMVVA